MAKITTPDSLYGNSRDILREAERENEILADIAGEEYESPGDIPKGKYVIEKRLLDAAQKKNELLETIAEESGGGSGAAKAIGIDYATDIISLKNKDGDVISGSGATLPAYGVSFDSTTGGLTLTKNGTAVQGQTVTIPNYGSPVGVTSSSDMTDHDTIYLYAGTTSGSYTNGHFYYWDGSAWADGGEYAAATVQTDKTLLVENRAADAKATGEAVGELKTQLDDVNSAFIDLGYNLVNVVNETLVEGKIINGSNNVSVNSTNESREIRIAAGKFKKIYIKAGTNNTIFAFLTATIGTYSSGQSISDIFASGENTRRVITHGTSEEFYIPTDCTVISFNIAASGNDYTPEFVCLCTEDGVIDRVIDEAINTIKTASKNLYDKYSATNQRGLNPNTGETAANNDYIVSDFIPVEAGETYVVSCGDGTEDLHLRYAFYNVNHVFISGGYYNTEPYTNYFTTPNNTAFVKIAVYNTLQNIQLEKGQTPTYFVPHLSVKDLTSDWIISSFIAARNSWDVVSGANSYPGWAVYDSPLSTPIASFTSEDGATYDSVNARWTLGLGQSIQIPVPTEAGELYHISIYFKNDDPEHDFIYQQHTQNPLTISLGDVSETIFFGPDVLGNIDLTASATASDTLFKIKMAETAGGIIYRVKICKILKLPEAIAKLNDNKIIAVYRNIAIGDGHEKMTSGANNTALGVRTQTKLTTAYSNTAVGYEAQKSVTVGSYNTAVGNRAQTALTEGMYNIAVGNVSQQRLTTGCWNVAIGIETQNWLTTGCNNVSIGRRAHESVTTGMGNVAVGAQSGFLNRTSAYKTTTGNRQTTIGFNTSQSKVHNVQQCNDLVAVGAYAKAGEKAIAVGAESVADGEKSIAIGYGATALGAGDIVIGTVDNTGNIIIAGRKINFNDDGTVTWTAVTP